MADFVPTFSKAIGQAATTYAYRGLDPEPRRYRAVSKMELATRAAKTLFEWLGKGQETEPWSKPVKGWEKKDLGYAVTHGHLVEAALFAYMSHSNARLPSLHVHVGRFVTENDHVDEVSQDDFERILKADLQQFTYRGAKGRPAKRNVPRHMRKILLESRLLAEDIRRKNLVEDALQKTEDPGEKAKLLVERQRYKTRINGYHPALMLFNAALAHAELDPDIAGHVPGAKLNELGDAIFNEYGPYLRQSGLYQEGQQLESKAFKEVHEDAWSKIDTWKKAHESDIIEAKNFWPNALKTWLENAKDERGKLLFADESGKPIGFSIDIRDKDNFGIWRKLNEMGKSSPDSVHDVLGARIVIDADDKDRGTHLCFKAMSLLGNLPKSSNLRVEQVEFPQVKNYVVNPKRNGYEAIHGIIRLKHSGFLGMGRVKQMEIQILDKHRHAFNESPAGASHWSHKAARYQTSVTSHAGEDLQQQLGTRLPNPTTIRVYATTPNPDGSFEKRFFDLPPGRKIIDLLGHALPDELGRRHIDIALHEESEKPPSRLFRSWHPSLFSPIFPEMNLQAVPEDRDVPIDIIRNWLAKPLSDNTLRVLRDARGRTQKLQE